MSGISKVNFLYTDGGVIQKNPSPIGGTWAYCVVSPDGDLLYEDYDVVPAKKLGGMATNNQMELLAIIRGLQTITRDSIVHMCSDSQVSLQRVFLGASMSNIPDWMVDALEIEKSRLALFKKFKYTLLAGHPTKAQLVDGFGKNHHPVSKWNVWVDGLCHKAADEYMGF